MSIPNVTTKIIADYLQPLSKKLCDTDINMYKERYLSFVRMCINNGKTYVHADRMSCRNEEGGCL